MGRMACDGALELIRQMLPVMAGGVYRLPCADQAISAVDADMVLVAKTGTAISMLSILGGLGLGELDRPARVAVLLAEHFEIDDRVPPLKIVALGG
jgi:hypothetical protein